MARLKRGEKEWHRRSAVDLFNATWELIERRRRTKDEDDAMVHGAHASRYHWGVVGKPVNWAIGEWQVSHVYAILGREEPATFHARRCLELCKAHGIGDFSLAYAYEALARADALAGRRTDFRKHVEAARVAGDGIEEKEDREKFLADLATVASARKR